jgi:hypothetical protein
MKAHKKAVTGGSSASTNSVLMQTPDQLLEEAMVNQDFDLADRIHEWLLEYDKLNEEMNQASKHFEFKKASSTKKLVLAIDTLEKFEQVFRLLIYLFAFLFFYLNEFVTEF